MPCKVKFSKKNYICSQPEKGGDNNENSNLEANTIEDGAISAQSSSSKGSSRQSCQYKSSLDDRICAICNEIKYIKGRPVTLLIITLRKG